MDYECLIESVLHVTCQVQLYAASVLMINTTVGEAVLSSLSEEEVCAGLPGRQQWGKCASSSLK